MGVFPVAVGSGAKPVYYGGNSKNGHEVRGDESNHRAEEQVAEYILYQLQTASGHIGYRLNHIPHLCRPGGTLAEITDFLLLIELVKTVQRFPVHIHLPFKTVFRQIGLGYFI